MIGFIPGIKAIMRFTLHRPSPKNGAGKNYYYSVTIHADTSMLLCTQRTASQLIGWLIGTKPAVQYSHSSEKLLSLCLRDSEVEKDNSNYM